MLSGVAPADNTNAIRRGQRSRHPRGFFIRYFPDSFADTKVEILVPERVVVTRDRLNRIIAIEDGRGGRTETVYNDAVAPRPHPRDARLKADAFKTIRFIRRRAGGAPDVHEIHDVDNRRSAVMGAQRWRRGSFAGRSDARRVRALGASARRCDRAASASA